MTEETVTVPRARLDELLAVEAAYREEHADEDPIAAGIARFRERLKRKAWQRRGLVAEQEG